MFKRSIVTPSPFTFTPSLKELGFKCCSDSNTREITDYGSIYISNLSKLNSLLYESDNKKANFKVNTAGYLTQIDRQQINLRDSGSLDAKGDDYVNSIFNAAATRSHQNFLTLTISIPFTSSPTGGTKSTVNFTHHNVKLYFTSTAAAAAAPSSRRAAAAPSSASALALPSRRASQALSRGVASSIISQATKPRESFKQEIIDHNKVFVEIIEIKQSERKHSMLQMKSMFFHSENNPDPTVNFNTSQILSALFFATMLPHTDITTNIDDISSYVQLFSKHSNNYKIIDIDLDIRKLNEQQQNIRRLINTLNDFEIIIDNEDTSQFMSKKQRETNLLASGRINSIYMVPDPTGSSQPKKITLLDLLRAAVTQLEKVRTVIGSGGPFDTFARQIQGGSKVNVKNNKQKTRRLHRNGHYNSRKRYD